MLAIHSSLIGLSSLWVSVCHSLHELISMLCYKNVVCLVNVQTHTHACTHEHAHTRMHTRTHACMHTHTYTDAHAHAHRHTHTHVCTHMHACTTHTHMHAHKHVQGWYSYLKRITERRPKAGVNLIMWMTLCVCKMCFDVDQLEYPIPTVWVLLACQECR